jgi:hypothetical protein
VHLCRSWFDNSCSQLLNQWRSSGVDICFLAFFTQLLRWRRRDLKDKVSEIPQDGWGAVSTVSWYCDSRNGFQRLSCEQFLDERVFKVIKLSHYHTSLFPLQVTYNLMTFIFKCFHQSTCRVWNTQCTDLTPSLKQSDSSEDNINALVIKKIPAFYGTWMSTTVFSANPY